MCYYYFEKNLFESSLAMHAVLSKMYRHLEQSCGQLNECEIYISSI